MTETVLLVASVCGALMTIWALLEKVSKPIKEIGRKLDAFQSWQKRQQADIEASKEEREILCRGFRALCAWATGQGANGEVSKAAGDLNEYLSQRAHEGKSFMKERE